MSHRLFTSCDDTEKPFSLFWNSNSTSQSRFAVLGTPSEVIAQIIDHVTAGRSDEHTAQTVETVRVMVGLSDDVIDGIKMLRQELDYTTLNSDNSNLLQRLRPCSALAIPEETPSPA